MLFLHQQGAYFCVLCNVFLKKLTETEQVEDKRCGKSISRRQKKNKSWIGLLREQYKRKPKSKEEL